MKTYEVVYYINMPDNSDVKQVENILRHKEHFKKLISVKEHSFIDISKLPPDY